MKKRFPRIIIQGVMCFLWLAHGGAVTSASEGMGPLTFPAHTVLGEMRLAPDPARARTMKENSFQAGVSETLSNVWSYDKKRMRLDYEVMETRLSLDYGVTPPYGCFREFC